MRYSLAAQDYAITSGGSSATPDSERLSQDRTPDSEFRPRSRARFKPGYFPGFRRWTRLCERATKARPGEADLPEMSSIAISLVVTGLITAGGLIGLVLQRFLPERYTIGQGPRHDRGRRRAADAPARAGQRPPDLDRLRRLQHPADGAPDDHGAGARVRSRNAPVRSRGGRGAQHVEDRSRLGARTVLGRRHLARRGL